MFQATIMSDSGVKSFFETHAHNYKMHPSFYSTIANKIKQDVSDSADLKLLDVGCGDGTFIKSLINAGVRAEFLATDISFTMTNMARMNLRLNNTEIFVADAFNMPLIPSMRFDVIHVAFLLHHLIGKTKAKSTALARKLISTLIDKISENGMLIIEEVYYNSYLLPKLTSSIIFYIMKVLNFLHFDSIHIAKQYKPGLQVRFFNESELEKMLRNYGSVHLLYRNPWKVPELYRIFLLEDLGNIVYALRKW
jgi:2-polyprenyl-3-methyl-5-hydroxy-6-metoxy-1,4-benzoquinol methylase